MLFIEVAAEKNLNGKYRWKIYKNEGNGNDIVLDGEEVTFEKAIMLAYVEYDSIYG